MHLAARVACLDNVTPRRITVFPLFPRTKWKRGAHPSPLGKITDRFCRGGAFSTVKQRGVFLLPCWLRGNYRPENLARPAKISKSFETISLFLGGFVIRLVSSDHTTKDDRKFDEASVATHSPTTRILTPLKIQPDIIKYLGWMALDGAQFRPKFARDPPPLALVVRIRVKVIPFLRGAYLIKGKTDRNEFHIPMRSRNFWSRWAAPGRKLPRFYPRISRKSVGSV